MGTVLDPPTVAFTDQLAETAHRGQVDKAGAPYIDHPRAVAALILDPGDDHELAALIAAAVADGLDLDNAVMAALLHDTVEDCGFTLDYLRSLGYDDEVVDAVDAVSRREGEIYLSMVRRARAHRLGRIVKLADNRHNAGRLDNLGPDERYFLTDRYRRARKILLAERRPEAV